MLSLRLAIVTAAAGLCLWGLFSLLDSLQEPGLLRSAKATIVKGCDSLESAQAAQSCPPLFCQKALLDAKLLPLRTRFEVSTDRGDENQQRVIGGSAYPGATNDGATHFICVVAGAKVIDARLVDRTDPNPPS
jgi:hypothetical protein